METNNASVLLDYMRGYAGSNPYNLELLQRDQQWEALARAELDRRYAAFIAALPDSVLEDIAAGALNITELAKQLRR